MKTFITSALILAGSVLAANTSSAQISVSFHIGTPPYWAPRECAHSIRYYYIPEADCYYDASRQGYYCNDEGSWYFSDELPLAFRGYDIGRCQHIPVRYFGNDPYEFYDVQRVAYVQRYHPEIWRRDYDRDRFRGEGWGHFDGHRDGDRDGRNAWAGHREGGWEGHRDEGRDHGREGGWEGHRDEGHDRQREGGWAGHDQHADRGNGGGFGQRGEPGAQGRDNHPDGGHADRRGWDGGGRERGHRW